MQVSAAQPGQTMLYAAAHARREQAFAQARRHSGHVKLMRAGIVVVSIGGVIGLVLVSVLDPFRVLPAGLSVGKAGLNGTKVTMEQPRMSGFRKDGRAYSVTADSSVQDLRSPTKIELFGINAKVAMADRSNARVSAATGLYDTQLERINFTSPVQMVSETGYNLQLKTGVFDFKASSLVSSDPVELQMTTGTITANSMQITDNGHKIVFDGNVVSIMLPASDAPAKVGLKGSSQ